MTYTCADYRLEMQLLALQRQLANERLQPEEKEALEEQILKLEQQMGMDQEKPKDPSNFSG